MPFGSEEVIMRIRDVGKVALSAALALSMAVPPALAQNDRGRDNGRYDDDHRGQGRGQGHDRDDDRAGNRGRGQGQGPEYRYAAPPQGWYDHGGRPVQHWNVPPDRRRVYRDVVVSAPSVAGTTAMAIITATMMRSSSWA